MDTDMTRASMVSSFILLIGCQPFLWKLTL
jgi:hypothetical protein